MIASLLTLVGPGSIAQRLAPVLSWLPGYRRDWLLPDVLAGLAVWAVAVPESMAYAGIVGVPPIMGLYTIVPPLVVYALLGSSRLLVVGPDTATGLISALTVGAIAAQGTADFNALTSTLATLIGACFLLFGVLRMGWVAAFIPTPVMRGFIEGLVCVTVIGQVPHLLGIAGLPAISLLSYHSCYSICRTPRSPQCWSARSAS
jgi:MFS superfamily sulfate permease-like transporter